MATRVVSSDSSGIAVSGGNAVLKGHWSDCWHHGQTDLGKKTMAGLPAPASPDLPGFPPTTFSGHSRR